MDLQQARALRDILEGTGWLARTHEFALALRSATKTPSGLLLFGPPADEPWHLTAHLADEARLARIPEIAPTLVRWKPPPGAPAHLSVGLERLSAARRGESLLVVAESAPASLLERVDDVRRSGANIFALDTGHAELAALSHEVLTVDADTLPVVSFDGAQHLLSIATAGADDVAGLDPAAATGSRRAGLRGRLGRLLDAISGP
jgi:hypothetical protein